MEGRAARAGSIAGVFHLVLHTPEIPGNSGNAIRIAATTGATLHLVRPLGFELDDARLRRAGLDYHDLAHLRVHEDLEALWAALPGARVFAFTASASRPYTDVAYRRGDVLLLGRESTGLPEEVMAHERVTARVRVPMVARARSMNVSNVAAIAVQEAWRQHGFTGAA